jgi:hypothetical protein
MSQVISYEAPALPIGNSFIQQAQALEVDDQVTYDIAIDTAREFKKLAADWEAKRKSYADPLNKLKEQVQADFMPIINALKEAETVAKRKAVAYIEEQEQVRRRAQAEADKLARIAAEEAESAAAKLEGSGDVEAAAAVREIAALMPAAVVEPLVEQSGGTNVRKVWKSEVTDWVALVKFIAANPTWVSLLKFDYSAADRLASATKGAAVIDGVTFRQESVLAIRK